MPERPKAVVECADFSGLVNLVDPRDLPAGAAEVQTNVQSNQPGQMTVRPGWRIVSFDD